MTDISREAVESALESATPGPWDKSNLGSVYVSGVLYPLKEDESRHEGESWLDMRIRTEPERQAREVAGRANAYLTSIAEPLAREYLALRDALDAAETREAWQPIETAPRDGTEVIVYVPSNEWVGAAWYSQRTKLWPPVYEDDLSEEGEPLNVGLPTHWRPLPTPPEPQS